MDANGDGAGPHPQEGAAFLLAQLGAHAAELFAQRIARSDLTPAQAGLLRLLARTPGRSQRELADVLGMPPSRFVPFVDDLERRGLLERRKNPSDRRLYALFLTNDGTELLSRLRVEAAAHEEQICAALTPSEHQKLTGLLRRLAQQQGLSPGVHPGYRSMRTSGTPAPDRVPPEPAG
ncbi:MarR family winged helix-turn-helix transcriptional regulator [Saccharopolyspora phatthalungensis]|uniref:DNA-binding MarR family transcriptional regulator n=1 Tax=Saccharopolyspora phatthalungensis TaxID=664693 RepID=A0A840QJJ9_9PSEU|nr:MarR family winged helix-turn-helix transcriptional regulator [Saccharopolyspora phatthalungensis]MBB5159239.1 DNA-binding MarR family transcriptional regulator [Saccharopolyspora phatthalungensis]